jgi:hypothetical protein
MSTPEDPEKVIEHVVVVALSSMPEVSLTNSHHARGPEVEYVYPPVSPDVVVCTTTASTTEANSTKTSPLAVPESWHLLPFMALPDGAHMVSVPYAGGNGRAKRTTRISRLDI